MNATALIPTLVLACTALAQERNALLFSPKSYEETRSGTAGKILRTLSARAVGVVSPGSVACDYSAEKFAPGLGWQTLVGDEDGDGDVHTPDLMDGIDAVLVKPYERTASGAFQLRTSPVDWTDLFVSPVEAIGTNVSGAPGLRPGDCGTYRRTPAGNGQVEHFIRAEHIIAAFGLFNRLTNQPVQPSELQLDAITVDMDRNIFLSLEHDRQVELWTAAGPINALMRDGAIGWIPATAWTPDARGNVASVVAHRGRIAFTEGAVNAMVQNAQVADYAGTCANVIIDTDGLAMDRNGGKHLVQWGGSAYTVPSMMFSGERLTGAAVLTTRGGGSIARMNNCRLAGACGSSTNGEQVGLLDSGNVGSLDGLTSLGREPGRFVLGSPDANGLGGLIEVHVGTNLEIPGVFLMVGLGNLPVSPSIDFHPWSPALTCFPEIYPGAVHGIAFWVPTPAHAFGDRAGQLGPIWAPDLPMGLVFQAAGFTPTGAELSSPVTIH